MSEIPELIVIVPITKSPPAVKPALLMYCYEPNISKFDTAVPDAFVTSKI